MAMSTLDPAALHATDMRCPTPACARTFGCDACLHAHLLRRHQARYSEAFGRVDEAFLGFCDEHVGVSPSMLGM